MADEEKDLIQQAKEAAEILKAENDRTQKLMEAAKSEEMTRLLSGRSDSNIQDKPKEKSKDELVTERCNEMLEGTGYKI